MIALVLAFGMSSAVAPHYRAELTIDGGTIAFMLVLGAEKATIINGAEHITAPVHRSGRDVRIDFPHYDSRIEARIGPDEKLTGTWTKARKKGAVATLPFTAVLARPDSDRYPRTAPDAKSPPLAGTWRMAFAKDGPAKGVCEVVKNETRCTVLTPTGDYRFLAGTLDGDRLRVSVFDGAHAFLFDARLAADGSKLTGDFYSGAHWHDTFTAEPAPGGFALPDGFTQTKLVGESKRLELPALDDPRFAGKAVIVEVFGSWCPNCHDAAATLADLQRRHGAKGLALLGVAFELFEDAERSQRQVDHFTKRHGLDWKVVVAGLSDKKQASKALPQLDRLRSYPTTIFVDRDRTVRAIHTGFNGPATGAEHTHLKAEFERLTLEILASKP